MITKTLGNQHYIIQCSYSNISLHPSEDGGPGAVAKAACLESRRLQVRTPLWPLSFKETKCFFPAHSYRFIDVGSLRDREVAGSASDRQGTNFESCVWRAV